MFGDIMPGFTYNFNWVWHQAVQELCLDYIFFVSASFCQVPRRGENCLGIISKYTLICNYCFGLCLCRSSGLEPDFVAPLKCFKFVLWPSAEFGPFKPPNSVPWPSARFFCPQRHSAGFRPLQAPKSVPFPSARILAPGEISPLTPRYCTPGDTYFFLKEFDFFDFINWYQSIKTDSIYNF